MEWSGNTLRIDHLKTVSFENARFTFHLIIVSKSSPEITKENKTIFQTSRKKITFFMIKIA